MNNHRKISFRRPDVAPTTESGKYYRTHYRKKKPENDGPEKQVKHPKPDHTNPSREDHIHRILTTEL
jgi:hypothetical protein